MLLLAVETSCDETSVAVLRDGCVLANAVSSQVKLHEEYGGVVPELASREHLRNLMPVARQALGQANVTPQQLDAVAATRGPGLPGALLVGLRAAQGMAFALAKPFIGIHHHEAHLYSPWIGGDPLSLQLESFEPNVSLIVSGGHTMLVHVAATMEHRVLGSTVDDAAGECFDKVAKLIGLLSVTSRTAVATAAGGPMIASSVIVSAVGSTAIGSAGMVGMAYSYVWSADIRTFVMASCAHGLRLGEELGQRLRPLFWCMLLAILVSLVGSVVMILYLAYEYGGINLNGWFFGGGTRAPFDYITTKLNVPTGFNLDGWVHTCVGGGIMALLVLARQTLLWWPLHPIGYPIGAVWLMDQLWFSIFLAWLVKLLVMKYGGPRLFRRARPFFLGMILGQFSIAGIWLIIDFFTGMTDNVVFWICERFSYACVCAVDRAGVGPDWSSASRGDCRL